MPRSPVVPVDVVIDLLGGFALLDVESQALVLLWIVLILDQLDDVERLARLYTLFFHYLDCSNLRFVDVAPRVSPPIAELVVRRCVRPSRCVCFRHRAQIASVRDTAAHHAARTCDAIQM